MKNKLLRYLAVPLVLLVTTACSSTGSREKNASQCVEWKKPAEQVGGNKDSKSRIECQSEYKIYFGSEKFNLQDAKTSSIKGFIDSIKGLDGDIIVIGHSDNTESDGKNLSLRRAESVANKLVEHKIIKTRIKILGVGKTYSTGDNKESRNVSLYLSNPKIIKCFDINGLCKKGCSLTQKDSDLEKNRNIEDKLINRERDNIARVSESKMKSTPRCCPCPEEDNSWKESMRSRPEKAVKEKVVKEKIVKEKQPKCVKEPKVKKEKIVKEKIIKEKPIKEHKVKVGCKPCCEIKPAKAYDPEALVKPANCK